MNSGRFVSLIGHFRVLSHARKVEKVNNILPSGLKQAIDAEYSIFLHLKSMKPGFDASNTLFSEQERHLTPLLDQNLISNCHNASTRTS